MEDEYIFFGLVGLVVILSIAFAIYMFKHIDDDEKRGF